MGDAKLRKCGDVISGYPQDFPCLPIGFELWLDLGVGAKVRVRPRVRLLVMVEARVRPRVMVRS